MAKPILVANWKNHPGSIAETQALLRDFSRKAQLYKKLAIFIAPPLPYLDAVGAKARSYAKLASQDLSLVTSSNCTGEVGVDILKSFGVKLAILGHSERRAQGETSEQVAEKVKLAMKANITPLVCVGETTRDADGEYFEFLREQLKSSLGGLNVKSIANVLIAYEPVWAIGGKEALNPQDLSEVILFLRKVLADLYGRKAAEKLSILYGGSVDPSNSLALMQGTGTQGLLVGRASLNAKSWEAIAKTLTSK